MLQTKIAGKIKTRVFMFKNSLPQFVPFVRQREKNSRAGQATNDNMAHARCALDN